jgi:prophage regulatory protein
MSGNLLEPFAVAASLSEMLLRVGCVSKVTGLSVPTIYRLMAKRDFPRPVKLTSYARAWKRSEIMAWIDSRPRGDSDAALQGTRSALVPVEPASNP